MTPIARAGEAGATGAPRPTVEKGQPAYPDSVS